MSGSRVLPSGVGTAIEIASASARRVSSVVASNLPLLNERGDVRGGDVLDVRLAAHEERDDALADVVADHLKARLGEFDRERQTDVAEADHADDGAPVLDALRAVDLSWIDSAAIECPHGAMTSSSCARVSSG